MTVADQLLVETTIAGQPLEKTIVTIRSMDLVLVEMMQSTLKSQENCLSQENRKAKKRLSLKIWLNQDKNLLKSRNSTNFDAIEAGPKFLTSDTRTIFNCL